MANAIPAPGTAPALVTLAGRTLMAATAAATKFRDFVTDFSADAVDPSSIIKVGINSVTKAVAFNASTNNYATGVEGITFASVQLTHYVNSENFTDAQLLQVPANVFNRAGDACGRGIVLGVSGAVDSVFVASSMTGTALTVPHDGTLSKLDIASGLAGGCDTDPARAVLVLNAAYYGKALALFDSGVYGGPEAVREGRLDGGVYGFKSIIKGNLPDGVVGAIVPEDAIVIVGRAVPCATPSAYANYMTQTDPETGITLGLRQFCQPETGTNCIAVETAFGAALAQGAKIQKITVAAQ